MLLTIIAIIIGVAHVADGVKCFCTEDQCVPYGSCDGQVCLVGILRDSNQVIRTCGSTTLGCHRDDGGLDKWTDLCACDQPFCNTFAFLRSHTSRDPQPQPPPPPPHEMGKEDDAPLVFHRVDRPDIALEPMDTVYDSQQKTSLLTLLLVVVPLTVGAATVMVVAFNYYCHLC